MNIDYGAFLYNAVIIPTTLKLIKIEKMQNKNIHAVSLGILLIILWILLSNHYTPLLMSLGFFSVVLVIWLTLRMDIIDHESYPLYLNVRALLIYLAWFVKEIFVSNIYVCRLILNPAMPISPAIISLRSNQPSDLARAILANSITLTPGTVAIGVDGDITTVHAITKDAATSLLQNSMSDKVAALVSRTEE